ncbi:MAG: SAM-dependent methyltransferase [Clostridia bacterium]|jgi:SAM-dependent methyltransferase|nr:SAM-dependent methyltransferase [Clostridia bacterium]
MEKFINEKLIEIVISNRRKKSLEVEKVKVVPVIIKEELLYQVEYIRDNKAYHENLDKDDIITRLNEYKNDYKQFNIYSEDSDYQVLVSKKGDMNIKKGKASRDKRSLSHNKEKAYVISEGEKCDFLIELGVMDKEGKVYKKKYDKFRQINKYLEIVKTVVDKLEKGRTINIIDFGCGKSYLTFGLYYYLVKILGYDVNIMGLDLKKDVINLCNDVTKKLKYEGLRFINGDINEFEGIDKVDMVVTLHACNNATDAAILKAIRWDAEVILTVPCCQHEFLGKIENEALAPMLKHGIVKEKLSSLVTDTLRSLYLEKEGYKVDMMEFIDITHTPKNILIRATKNNKKVSSKEYEAFKATWNLKDIFIEKNI